jgi:4'-phosphopantetheinyl transferase
VEIYAVNLKNHFNIFSVNALLRFLDNEKINRIKKYKFIEDQVRALYGDFLVRYILVEKYGYKNEEIKYRTNKFGKPFLENIQNIHFNYSHSGDWVVCAIDNKPIGIDIQEMVNINLDISKFILSEKELHYMRMNKEIDQKRCFFDLWTLKESYIKALGIGMSKELKSFTVEINKSMGKIHCEGWQLKLFNLDENYCLAVCTKGTEFADNPILLSVETIQCCFINN